MSGEDEPEIVERLYERIARSFTVASMTTEILAAYTEAYTAKLAVTD